MHQQTTIALANVKKMPPGEPGGMSVIYSKRSSDSGSTGNPNQVHQLGNV
jgi:hypothetical protein